MLHLSMPPSLFVSAPLTGGEHVDRVLRSVGTPRVIVAPGSPVWMVDDREEYAFVRDNPQLLRVGFVRDPWTWYAGVWNRALRTKRLDALRVWGRGSLSFKSFVYGATHPEHLVEVPRPLGILWGAEDAGGWQGLRASTLGLCSFSYLYFYGEKRSWQQPDRRPVFGVDVLVDAARLPEALTAMLAAAGDSEALAGALRALPSLSDASRAALAASYDTDMVKWVEEADGPLVALMGYRTPFLPGEFEHTLPVRRLGSYRRGPGRKLSRDEAFRIQKARVRAGMPLSPRLEW